MRLVFSFSAEIALEPSCCQTRYFLQGSRLLKQMGRARHDRQLFFRFEFFISLSIEIDHYFIERANDEEGRRQYS